MNQKKTKEINDAIAKLKTPTEKLGYYKKNVLEKYQEKKDLFKFYGIEENSQEHLLGPLKLPATESGRILIPQLDIPKNDQPIEYRIEYHRWILNFRAEKMFEEELKPFYEKEIIKPLGKEIISGKIKSIDNIQTKAKNLLSENKIDIYEIKDLSPEKLYLWYKNDYYNESIEWLIKERVHIESVCYHKHLKGYLKSLLKSEIKKNEILTLLKINIEKLVDELFKRRHFDEKDKIHMINWFKGIALKDYIHINVPMSHFVSVIASLCEEKFIKNSKTFCYSLIQRSFLFKNKKADLGSIINAMKRNSPERIKKTDKNYYIDIQQYIL